MGKKTRLDVLMVQKGLASSRVRAQALILQGRVLVNGTPCDKAGTPFPVESKLTLKGEDLPFVSRGGLKIDHALTAFDLGVEGKVCIDVGASTGGFTDCLLQRGAKKVYAVDVGYGQLAWSLQQDPRVVVMDRVNARHLQPGDLPEPPDLAVMDASFISLKLIVPPVLPLLKPDAVLLPLVKPQFEVGRGQVGKKGIVKDPEKHEKVLKDLATFFGELSLKVLGHVACPHEDARKNQEFFMMLQKQGSA